MVADVYRSAWFIEIKAMLRTIFGVFLGIVQCLFDVFFSDTAVGMGGAD